MLLRAKTKYLFDKFKLSSEQNENTILNINEIENKSVILKSAPRRLVFELTNACNLNCIMCGRNNANFKPTFFDIKYIDKFKDILNKTEEVSLFGWGEPTVHPKFVDILKYLDQYNVRKYFCTNGMKLDVLKEAIFQYNVDIIAISIDGAVKETNDRIRKGSNLDKIILSLKEIVKEKKSRKIDRPYMNFVFCAMKSNLHEIPKMVELAHEIGLEEVKVVYFTSFDGNMIEESLWGLEDEVEKVFNETLKIAEKLDIKVKLPHLQGKDEAGNKYHKDCYVGWRDLFLGSDGYVRPCMSTPINFFNINDYSNFEEIWNNSKYIEFRKTINDQIAMPEECKRCYQSSHCNWNREESFKQISGDFAPNWDEQKKI